MTFLLSIVQFIVDIYCVYTLPSGLEYKNLYGVSRSTHLPKRKGYIATKDYLLLMTAESRGYKASAEVCGRFEKFNKT